MDVCTWRNSPKVPVSDKRNFQLSGYLWVRHGWGLVRLFTLIVLFSLKPPEATVAKYQHLLKFQLVSHVEVCFFCIYLCVNYFIIIVKIIGFYYLVHTIF